MAGLRQTWVIVLAAMAWPALATPAASADEAADAVLQAAAESTIRRLPTCEMTIRARTSEWKAAAAIGCRRPAAPNVAACVDARLRGRADQLKRLRSCRFL